MNHSTPNILRYFKPNAFAKSKQTAEKEQNAYLAVRLGVRRKERRRRPARNARAADNNYHVSVTQISLLYQRPMGEFFGPHSDI